MTKSKTELPQRYANRASVNTIREVFDYISRYRGKIFVLKIEDSLIGNPLFPLLMKDIIQLHNIGVQLIIVTGTRTTIARNLTAAGIKSTFVKGIRITPDSVLPHIKLAAMEVVQTIISHLAAGGANGIMGNWTKARSLGVRKGIDFQWTGQVEKVRSDIVHKLLAQEFIPVLYNIGLNAKGDCYNLNSNQITRQLCLDLNIEKLFFIRSQDALTTKGLLIPPGAQVHPNGKILSNIDLSHVDFILSNNHTVLSPEDRELLAHAKAVISRPNGVNRVHIIDGRKEGRLLQEVFTSVGGGTMVYGNRYAHIRRATQDDVPEIMHLMDGYVKKGNLVMRTDLDIKNQINDYYIYEVDHAIYGCGALYDMGQRCAEIGAIAVNTAYKSKGVGRGIMQYLIQKARDKNIKTLFLLTTRAADWFFEFGFIQGRPEDLPEHRKNNYNMERNSRVLLLDL
ncbi:N-acetylglutamate synthase [Desulfocicer vacuolatum DSM 3385]|uniref:amino-acid N-acetyltransferase n=1 Tax=Desulfocicer vacuolatum DSM 3385 TaxID=1121400 RepID=A0A1W2AFD2_9BACT|nr:amino-acid N-acetyltransferase [Desulfocicer vacuolatum]SMC59415.1 N-acetylglutamate synthase [Desulfocicer vacuolatum DSM 3385]